MCAFPYIAYFCGFVSFFLLAYSWVAKEHVAAFMFFISAVFGSVTYSVWSGYDRTGLLIEETFRSYGYGDVGSMGLFQSPPSWGGIQTNLLAIASIITIAAFLSGLTVLVTRCQFEYDDEPEPLICDIHLAPPFNLMLPGGRKVHVQIVSNVAIPTSHQLAREVTRFIALATIFALAHRLRRKR